MQALLRSLLKKYEERFLMMDVPLLDCPQQDKMMSDYTFETGKMTPDEYQAIHNGPDFTEVTILFVSPSTLLYQPFYQTCWNVICKILFNFQIYRAK